MENRKQLFKSGMAPMIDVINDQQNDKNAEIHPLNNSSSDRYKNLEFRKGEDVFIQNAKAIILKNIHLPDFTIEDLADILGISRSQLFRKLKSAVDQTPLVFIHSLRMDKAAQLLVTGDKNISEVAYSLGFSDVNYFRKVFHKYFGMSPSKYIETHKMNILSIVS